MGVNMDVQQHMLTTDARKRIVCSNLVVAAIEYAKLNNETPGEKHMNYVMDFYYELMKKLDAENKDNRDTW